MGIVVILEAISQKDKCELSTILFVVCMQDIIKTVVCSFSRHLVNCELVTDYSRYIYYETLWSSMAESVMCCCVSDSSSCKIKSVQIKSEYIHNQTSLALGASPSGSGRFTAIYPYNRTITIIHMQLNYCMHAKVLLYMITMLLKIYPWVL